jgi:hypothetical protein
MKYWFRDFQKKKFIDFLDKLELFIGEKKVFTNKKKIISRVTYPSIRNFKLNSKKYTLWGLKCNHKSEPKNLNKFLFLKLMKTLDMFSNIKAFGLIHVHRKFNCRYATHFFLWIFIYLFFINFILFILILLRDHSSKSM